MVGWFAKVRRRKRFSNEMHLARSRSPGAVWVLLFCSSPWLASAYDNPGDKIVGGAEICIENAPYMLSFLLRGHHACGACVLNRVWALTAAHCVSAANDVREITLRSGSARLYHGALHFAIRAVVHENYNEDDSDYDVAVVKVFPAFSMSPATRPVGLPWPGQDVKTDWGIVTGWGYFSKDEDGSVVPVVSDQLQYAYLPKIDHAQCMEDYAFRFVVTPRQVCYGFPDGRRDTCKGDSGGPLVNEDNVVIGITSWGDGCAERDSPGVYTDVRALSDWVLEQIYAECDY